MKINSNYDINPGKDEGKGTFGISGCFPKGGVMQVLIAFPIIVINTGLAETTTKLIYKLYSMIVIAVTFRCDCNLPDKCLCWG